jgi:hypothetical protein
MLVGLFNVVKVESVPLKSEFCATISPKEPPHVSDQRLGWPPRHVPLAFLVAELPPFRWCYVQQG